MSIKTQILDTLKKLVGVYEEETFGIAEEAKDAPVVEAVSESTVKISQREVGGKVERIGSEGQLEPIEDGDYEMEDGFAFTVKDGVIVSIVGQEAPAQEEEAAKEEEEEKPSEEPAAEEAPAEEPKEEEAPAEAPAQEEKKDEEEEELAEPNPEVEALKVDVAAMKETIAALIQMIEEMKGNTATKEEVNAFSAQVADLDSNIKKLAKVPVEFSKTTTSNTVKDNKEEKLIELAKMLGRK